MFDVTFALPLFLAQEAGTAPPPPATGQTVGATPATTTVAGDGTTTTQPGATGTPGAPATPAPSGGGGFDPTFMIMLLVIMGLFIFMSTWSQRKEKKKRQALLDAVKKGDRVQTIGGMIGTVAELRDHEVVLKVDDNTRLKFARSAIQGLAEERVEDKK